MNLHSRIAVQGGRYDCACGTCDVEWSEHLAIWLLHFETVGHVEIGAAYRVKRRDEDAPGPFQVQTLMDDPDHLQEMPTEEQVVFACINGLRKHLLLGQALGKNLLPELYPMEGK